VGPAIAGILIAAAGVGVAFVVNAVSFVAVLVGLLRMDVTHLRRTPPTGRRKGQAREGLRYVRASPELRAVLLLVLVVATFGQNFRVVLPLLAQDTFRGGAEVYGYLTAALGLGAVLGALFSASRESATSWALVLACLAFGAVNLAAAAVPTLISAYLAMVAIGFANIVFNTLGRTVLQLGAEPSMHGRVLALHGLVFLGSTPFGGPLLGWICEAYGTRSGFVLASLTSFAAAAWFLPRLRGMRPMTVGQPGPAAGIVPPETVPPPVA